MRTIVHLIESLGPGGAENLLADTIEGLPGWHHIVGYLDERVEVMPRIRQHSTLHFLNHRGHRDFPRTVLRLRRLIRNSGACIVHSHSYWTHILSRLATPRRVALFNHYHFADYGMNPEGADRMIRLDRLTYRRGMRLLCVSDYVAQTVRDACGYKDGVESLKNFIGAERLAVPRLAVPRTPGVPLRMVAIGHLKREKNYDMVVEAFRTALKDEAVEMDIFGWGPFEEATAAARAQSIHNLRFRGIVSSPRDVLPDYHLYTMTSVSEACPLSPIEAAAAGLPLLLSDIPALLELAPRQAVYFQSNKVDDFIGAVRSILTGNTPLQYGSVDHELLERYSAARYFETLTQLYEAACPSRQ